LLIKAFAKQFIWLANGLTVLPLVVYGAVGIYYKATLHDAM
jgi:heme exporter protein D